MAKSKFKVIWSSAPVFDKWGIQASYWGCYEWQKWHSELKRHFGKKTADETWLYAWDLQTMGASPLDCRSFNSDFKKFLRREGIADEAGNIISHIIGGSASIISGLGKAAIFTAGSLKIVIPVLLIGLTAGAIIYVYRSAKGKETINPFERKLVVR